MDINQLLYFQKVAELQHMTKAAEELNISQAALSQAIRSLERELGVQLFERVGRNIALSAYGQVYLSQVSNALVSLKRGENYILDLKKKNDNSVKLIAPTLFGFPGLFSIISRQCTGFKISIFYCALREIAAKLKTGQADLCISRGRIEDKELSGLRLHTFELGLLVSKNSPLAACESVQLSELKDHEFASFLAGSGHRRNVELMCNQAGWSPKVTLETNHYADIVRAVATGRYVATVVRNIYENYGNGDVRFVRIEGADTRVEVWLHWDSSERLNPLAHKLKKIFIDYFEAFESGENKGYLGSSANGENH